jgi:hypothetical protein
MTCTVSFVTPGPLGTAPGIGIKRVRAREIVTVPGTTTTTALDGEFIVVGNGDSVMNAVAIGSTPDAASTAESAASGSTPAGAVTSAGFPVAAGQVSDPFVAKNGDKVNIKVA